MASNFGFGIQAYKNGDYVNAKKYFELAIEEDGALQAQYMIGLLYLDGLGVKKSLKKAEEMFLNASKIGNRRAECMLAKIYLTTKSKSLLTIRNLLESGYQAGADECLQIARDSNIKLSRGVQ